MEFKLPFFVTAIYIYIQHVNLYGKNEITLMSNRPDAVWI